MGMRSIVVVGCAAVVSIGVFVVIIVVVVVVIITVVVDFVVGCVVSLAHIAKPSSHVCSIFGSPGLPHLPCQEPPRLQHVRPSRLGTHVGHSGEQSACCVVNAIDDVPNAYVC